MATTREPASTPVETGERAPSWPLLASEGEFGRGQVTHRARDAEGNRYETACGKTFGPNLDAEPGWGVGGPVTVAERGEDWTVPSCEACRAASPEHQPYNWQVLEACAAWLEQRASTTLTGDPLIRAADWAAKMVREYARRSPVERLL